MIQLLSNLFHGVMGRIAEESANQAGGNILPVHRQSLHREERLRNEVLLLAERFSKNGGIYCDEQNFDWIMVPKYPLPERWGERWCQLLIVVPATYPETAPLGFYLNRRFELKNGGYDPHATSHAYHGAPDLLDAGWHWYCVTVENGPGGWRPSADYRQPDNLHTFLNMARESLTNDT